MKKWKLIETVELPLDYTLIQGYKLKVSRVLITVVDGQLPGWGLPFYFLG